MKERDNNIDIIRGVAILLVVLGHSLSAFPNSECSLIFNAIWTIQMPLFFLISGYVMKYSSRKPFSQQLLNKTVAYLLPFFVWTFIVRGIIYSEYNFLNVSYLIYHMDSGYWFLFSLWSIIMVHTICHTVSLQVTNVTIRQSMLYLSVFAICLILLGVLGYTLGMSFLGIKYTLYYSIFFIIGTTYSKIEKLIDCRLRSILVAISFAVWLSLIYRFNFYSEQISIIQILTRLCVSLTGCITAVTIIMACVQVRLANLLTWFGKHSLQIYLTHYLFLSIISVNGTHWNTTLGFVTLISNYVLCLICCYTFIRSVSYNSILNYLLFAKK